MKKKADEEARKAAEADRRKQEEARKTGSKDEEMTDVSGEGDGTKPSEVEEA